MAEEVKLLTTWSSPFGLRAVWALELKGIHYDSIDEDLSNKSALLLQYNPVYKKVPVLVHNGKSISESLMILEYIDDTWRQNPLLPEDPYERARARFFTKFGNVKLMPSIWNVFMKEGKEQEEAIVTAFENLKVLEEELRGKKFFAGEMIGLLDIVLGWLVNLVPVFDEMTSLKMKIIDGERFPLLFAWMQEFSDAPVIKESWPPHDKMLNKFKLFLKKFGAAGPPE